MIIAIPLNPQPILHSNRRGEPPTWRWAYKNQWTGDPVGTPSTSPGKYVLPMVGACWLDGLEPLKSGAAGLRDWSPYKPGWVIHVEGDDHIVDNIDLVRIDLAKHNEIKVFDEWYETSSPTVGTWGGQWVWLLYLK